MPTRLRVLHVLAGLFLSALADAQAPAMGPEFRIGDSGDYLDTMQPAAVARPDGGFLVMWADSGALKWREYGDDLRPLGDEALLDTNSPPRLTGASPGFQPDGGFVVLWQDYNTTRIQAVARRYAPDGTPRGQVFAVDDASSGDVKEPDLSVDGAGDFVVVWRNRTLNSVTARRYDASGDPKAPSFQVAAPVAPQYSPVAAAFPNGAFVVVWQVFENGGVERVHGRVFGPSGEPISNEFIANDDPDVSGGAPTVVIDPAGGFLVGWSGDTLAPVANWARRYDALGQPRGPKFALSTREESSPGKLKLAMMPDGRYLATWDSDRDGSFRGIVGQRFDASDERIGGEFQINTVTYEDQREQAAAILPDGTFLVVWQSRNPAGIREGFFLEGRGGLLGLDADIARMPVASASPRALPRLVPPRVP